MAAYSMPSLFTLLLLVCLVVPGSLVASAPAKTSEHNSVDKLVAAAQSALQQAKQNTSAVQRDDLDLGRHKGDSFTSPVDGYFIQVRFDICARRCTCPHRLLSSAPVLNVSGTCLERFAGTRPTQELRSSCALGSSNFKAGCRCVEFILYAYIVISATISVCSTKIALGW